MKDHKDVENTDSQKSVAKEKEMQKDRETTEIIRKAMEKARAEEQR